MSSLREEIATIKRKVEIYLRVGRYEAAEKALTAALADFGAIANIQNLLGVVFHKQSKFPEAIQQFKQAIKTNPMYLEANLNLAATLCDLSRYREAEEIFQALNETINPAKKIPYLILGRLANQHAISGKMYEDCGFSSSAIHEYRKALTLYPKMPDVRLALAKLFVRDNQLEEALTELNQLVEFSPDNTQAHIWLGIVHYKIGSPDLAKKQWEKAYQTDPGHLTAKAYFRFCKNPSVESFPDPRR